MSSAIREQGYESACHQGRMDFQHLKGNVLGWQQLKRKHSPPRDVLPLKKRYGSENVSPESLKAKDNFMKNVQETTKSVKKTANKAHPRKVVKEANTERLPEQEVVPTVEENVENGFDMDDIIPIQLNLDKVPVKYCDDRLYLDLVTNDDLRKAETQPEDESKKADENFRKKLEKPLNDLMNLFDIRTSEESLQYMLVGMKLQLLGLNMAKPGDKV